MASLCWSEELELDSNPDPLMGNVGIFIAGPDASLNTVLKQACIEMLFVMPIFHAGVVKRVLVAPLPFQLPAVVPGEAMDDSTSVGAPVAHGGDLDGAPGCCLLSFN